MKKIVIGGVIVYIVTLIATLAILKFKDNSRILLSPVSNETSTERVLAAQTLTEPSPSPSPETVKKNKLVFGFLPFWTMKDINPSQYKDVDVVYYFSLTVKGDGDFDKTDPGWGRLKDFPKAGKKQGLTVACMKQDDIAALIQNPARQKKVITETIALMKKYNLSQLNVDFEYITSPPANFIKSYTAFIKLFTDELHKNIPGSSLSVATLSDAVWKTRMYDISEIGKVADYIIVMAYDFTRLPSASSGPVAPLFGKEKFEYDIYTTVTDYIKSAPPEKVVMGMPFYGYEWSTVDNKPYSFTLSNPAPAMSTIKRTAETIKKYSAMVMFDDLSKTPWISYFDPDGRVWRQVWFENERSLGLKMDLVNQAELAGMAIWALGYEGENPEVWGLIREKML